ncbi:MAG TPA: bifunctional glutamate N-acetyltransferase/amino-acid acetyltransferase ArgJ [Kofleriaceae bacterium]|nr:bifunctional glutamate N-acetyltransferase/amino-acid acetyltransferase ArgJ [Kofleriaceae bacterium]
MPNEVRGFRFAGVAAGIKSKGGLDVGIMAADRPCPSAAVFTQNRVAAAPVGLSRAALARSRGLAQVVVVNSGNANALTGAGGEDDARRMIAAGAAATGARAGHVLVASTGVIGVRLPIAEVERGIAAAAAGLGPEPARFDDFATAILTTDRAAKVAEREVGGARLIGCTKGAGMIAPTMATTLTFVATDAAGQGTAPPALARLLTRACAHSFNAITVDGDTSTNDMLLVMTSRAGPAVAASALGEALGDLLDDLARQLMRGGEGVHHVVTVEVRGARSTRTARLVAERIARSPLVKTAIAGADPNWGRILAAAGNAGVALDPARLALDLDEVVVVRRGVAVADADREARARAVMQRPEYTIVLDLGQGEARARHLACDLSHDYVSINAEYRT